MKNRSELLYGTLLTSQRYKSIYGDEFEQVIRLTEEIKKEKENMPTRYDRYGWVPTYGDLIFHIDKDRTNVIKKGDIELVNFNEKKGVTVVKWKDGTISKVKVQTDKGDVYNPELGLAMCIAKKAMGNKGNFNDVFKKWMPE